MREQNCKMPTVRAQLCNAVILKVFFLSKKETRSNNSIYCYVTLFKQKKKKQCCEGHLEIDLTSEFCKLIRFESLQYFVVVLRDCIGNCVIQFPDASVSIH